jgi:hypothetical protein
MRGATAATPPTAAMVPASERSTRPRSGKSPPPTWTLERTSASVPALALARMPANPVVSVCTSTRVADRNATPSSTAEQVASRRRLRAAMDLRVIRHMVSSRAA